MLVKGHIKPQKNFNPDELMSFLAKELNIKNDAELTITYNSNLLNKLSKEVEFEAFLQNPFPDKYVLILKENIVGVQYILCHEFIHLKQYQEGRLKISSDFQKVWWEGKEYDDSTPYGNREWEKEAFSMQNKLWRKFKKYKKNEIQRNS